METPVKTTHPIGFWFFFWGEFAERCSYYGMRAILALYMVERLGVDKGDAGTYMSLFIGACYAFPLIGGYIADNFFGKYWTIVLFAVPYVVAQFLVGTENKMIVFGSLVLLAMGSGVIKPNISTLMGLTYDQQRPGQEQLRTSAFSWFYMSINIGAFISQLSMPWLRVNHGYQVAFIFPAILMALALVIFAMGKRFYGQETIVRKVVGKPGDTIPPTKTFTGIPVSFQVMSAEELAADKALKYKVLGRIGALFLLVMFFWAIFDQSASTWIFFADTYMDTTLLGVNPLGQTVVPMPGFLEKLVGDDHFNMSADALQSFNPLFIILLVPVSVAFFKVVKVKATTKMAIGFLLTAASMLIMSLAGFQAGAKYDMVKVTFVEGTLVLPEFESKLVDVTKSVQPGAVNAKGRSHILSASDGRWNPDNKKLEVRNGTLTLQDGKVLEIKNGRIGQALPKVSAVAVKGDNPAAAESTPKSAAAIAKIEPSEKDKVTFEMIDWVMPEQRISVWWQVFAYLILTIAEILISVTGLELAFVAAPKSMKSFVTACWLAVVALANYLINAPITQLYPTMAPGLYFAMLGTAMFLSLFVFIPVAKRFNQMMATEGANA